jgi:hypothetical protein
MHVKSSITDAKQDSRTFGMGTRRHVSLTPNMMYQSVALNEL